MKYNFGILATLVLFATTLQAKEMPLVFETDFESPAKTQKEFFPTDAPNWETVKVDGQHAYKLKGKSKYNPPYRSPHSISLINNKIVGDFVLTARVQTLQTTRGHRDMCIFFGWQNPSQFYYVHLGEKPDPNSSQIFIVNEKIRTPITETENVGIPWKDSTWHNVKVVRKIKDGLIEIYFDDMTKPQKVAHDKTFQWGMIGLGSFDDLGLWDDVKINGVLVEGKKAVLPEPNRSGETVNK